MTETVKVPNLVGMRQSVMDLLSDLPDSASEVTLDFTANEVIAQGACDEMVRSLAQLRNVKVIVVSPSERARKLLSDSAARRSVTHLLVFAD